MPMHPRAGVGSLLLPFLLSEKGCNMFLGPILCTEYSIYQCYRIIFIWQKYFDAAPAPTLRAGQLKKILLLGLGFF
jgi:hypothetical protein